MEQELQRIKAEALDAIKGVDRYTITARYTR